MIAAHVTSRFAGLDGLRAIAVVLVVAYHLFPGSWIRGGFIGVDVFFVISGFLITALLLREQDAFARVDLAAFWRRRARRLLPALGLVVTVCATTAWVVGGDLLVRLGEQVRGAATFSYNWTSIAGGTGYFADATPELFRNVWSLAVEEQFYVLWPLVFPLFLLLPRSRWRAGAAVGLGALSAGWMTVLVATGTDVTRAYFGTDTHAFGILLGVALAFLLQRPLAAPPEWMLRPRVRAATGAAGAGAVGGIVLLTTVPAGQSAATFPGVLLAASILTAVAIVGSVWPRSALGPALDRQPLTWIGARSYGIYLWHWPLLVLVVAATGSTVAATPWPLGLGVLGLTLAVSEISYRVLEMPIRRRGFRATARGLGRRLTGTPVARLRAIVAVAVAAAMLGGTSAAIAAAPETTSGETAVQAGIDALHDAKPAPTPVVALSAASPAPSPTPVTGSEVSAIGDSVMLASAPALLERYPGIQIDAAVSRSTWAGPGILQALADSGQLRAYVVIGLGTNGPVDEGSLERMAQIAGPDRHIVLVNAFAPRDWIAGVNADLTAFAAAHPGTAVADWSGAIAGRTGLLAGDHIHPGEPGGRVYADAVAQAVADLEADRAMRAFRADRWAQVLLRLTLPAER
ncbi:acyltransferase family protein [Microbacterium sp. B2969]|uniref:Acyltransferase family protein n=1 Tax=Microbacterium alkaliflavum TaxID=3248839 RepID=A0ABW7QFF7_9MICO